MSERILFIHHGGIAGGAPLSMLYTMEGVRAAGYLPIVALVRPMPELHKLYNDAGFRTIETPWIPMFITWSGSEGKWWNPIMWKGVYNAFKGWGGAKKRLQELVENERIDLVHLNSVGLSNCAEALIDVRFPFVWHVREHGPSHKGIRYRRISSTLAKADHVVFLSNAERESWLSGDEHGVIVHNFVDFEKFDDAKSLSSAKRELNITTDEKVILYVGGSKSHKGVLELLNALELVKEKLNVGFVCLMPDSEVKNVERPTSLEARMAKYIQEKGLDTICRLMPFNPDIVDLFAACDVLVFPATKPHFARPVIEASAMGKPVIASNLKAIDELVKDGKTGFLVSAGSAKELADRIIELFETPALAAEMGKAGKEFALEEFEFHKQVKKILNLYEKALNP